MLSMTSFSADRQGLLGGPFSLAANEFIVRPLARAKYPVQHTV